MDSCFEDFTSLESAVKTALNRRAFIGGSDARIIMSPDEAALIQLWKEKRGEAEPESQSRNLIVQLDIREQLCAVAQASADKRRYSPIPRGWVGSFALVSRRRTPTPPPFSSMNSTPPDSKQRRTTSSVARRG